MNKAFEEYPFPKMIKKYLLIFISLFLDYFWDVLGFKLNEGLIHISRGNITPYS